MLLEIGSRVLGSDGRCGRIAGLVVVPGATGGEVTHLVVHAVLPHVADRLVPVSAVDTETSEWDRKTHHGHDCELAWTSDEVLDAAPATMSTVVDLGEDHALPHMERSTGLAAPLTWSLRADEGCGWPEDDGSSVVGTGRYQVVTEPQNPPGTVRLDAAAHVVAEDGSRVGTVRAVEVAADWTIKRVVLDHHRLSGKREITLSAEVPAHVENDRVRFSTSAQDLERRLSVHTGRAHRLRAGRDHAGHTT